MLRRLALLSLLWPAAAPARADQQLQDNIDGAGFDIFDVGELQANNLAGSGTRCAAVDSTGNIIPMSVACGTGTVTGVTGANGVSCTGSTSVTCTIATASCPSNEFVSAASSSSGLVCTQPSFANLSGSAACSQLPLDGVSLVCGGGFASVGTVQASNVAAASGGIGYFNVSSELASDPTNFGWNDSTRVIDIGTTTAPSAPGGGVLACWADSTGLNLTCKNTGGIVTHGAQTQTSSTGVALTGLSAQGGWTLQSFQAPLTACTNYVSVSCQGGTSDIGTGGSNSAVQVDAFHDFGGQRWTYGTEADGEFARFDVAGGKFVAASTIAGDGTSISCSNTGIPPENLTCSMVNVGTAGTYTTVTTNAKGQVVSGSQGPSKLLYSLQASLSAGTSNCGLFEGGNGIGAGCTIVEYPNDFQAGTIQRRVYVKANTVTAGTLSFVATLNGTPIGGTGFSITSATPTGVNVGSSLPTGSTSANDTYGLTFTTSAGYTGGFQTVTVEVLLTQ